MASPQRQTLEDPQPLSIQDVYGIAINLNKSIGETRTPEQEVEWNQLFRYVQSAERVHTSPEGWSALNTLKREMLREAERRSGGLERLDASVDKLYTDWRGAVDALEQPGPVAGGFSSGGEGYGLPAPKPSKDLVEARDGAYAAYQGALRHRDRLSRGLQGLYVEPKSFMGNLATWATEGHRSRHGLRQGVSSGNERPGELDYQVPEAAANLVAMDTSPQAQVQFDILYGERRQTEGSTFMVNTSFGAVDIGKHYQQFSKPEVKESIRRAMLGVDPKYPWIQKGTVSGAAMERVVGALESEKGVESEGFQWDVRTSYPGVTVPYLPSLYPGEAADAAKSWRALRSPSSARAFMQVVQDMQAAGELRRSGGEVAMGQGVGMAEFIAINMALSGMGGAALKGAGSAKKAAKVGSMAERFPVIGMMARTATAAGKVAGYGRKTTYWRGVEFTGRNVAEEIAYGVVRGAISNDETMWEGGMEGLGEGAAESVLGGFSKLTRKAGWRVFKGVFSEKIQRLGGGAHGVSSIDRYWDELDALPSRRVDLRGLVKKTMRTDARVMRTLQMMDAMFVGASFGGYEAAISQAGAGEWERMSVGEKALAVAANMASPEAIGNMGVFMGAGAFHGGAQKMGFNLHGENLAEQEEAVANHVAKELVNELLDPDNSAQFEKAVEMFDGLRASNPDLFGERFIRHPLEKTYRADDGYVEHAHWREMLTPEPVGDPLEARAAEKEGRPERKARGLFDHRGITDERAAELADNWHPSRVDKWGSEALGGPAYEDGKREATSYTRALVEDGPAYLYVHSAVSEDMAVKRITDLGPGPSSGPVQQLEVFGLVRASNPTQPIDGTQLWTTLEGAMAQGEHVMASRKEARKKKRKDDGDPPSATGQQPPSSPDGPAPTQGDLPFGEFPPDAEPTTEAPPESPEARTRAEQGQEVIDAFNAGVFMDPETVALYRRSLEALDPEGRHSAVSKTLRDIEARLALPREETQAPEEKAAAQEAQAADPQTAHTPVEDGPKEAIDKENRSRVERSQPAEEFNAPVATKAPRQTPKAQAAVQDDADQGFGLAEVLERAEKETVPVSSIELDPATFQHKSGTDSGTGVDPKSTATKAKAWSKTGERPIVLYQYADGRYVVADGHQRFALAKRLGLEGMDALVLREADGVPVEGAKVVAGFANIQHGTASPTDVAKLLRNLSADEFAKSGVDPRSGAARIGYGLSRLTDEVFGMVEAGKIKEGYAAEIGQALEQQPQLQMQVAKEVIKANFRNKDQVAFLAKQIANDAVVKTTQASLFGDATEEVSLYTHKARVIDGLIKTVKRMKGAFGSLAKNAAFAEKIESHVNVELAQEQHGKLGGVVAAIETLGASKGTQVNEIVNKAAMVIAEGGDARKAIKTAAEELQATDLLADLNTFGQRDPVSPADSGRAEEAVPAEPEPEVVAAEPEAAPAGEVARLAERDTGQQLIGGGTEKVVLEGKRSDLPPEKTEQFGLFEEPGELFKEPTPEKQEEKKKGYKHFGKLLGDLQEGRTVVYVADGDPIDLRRDLEANGIAYDVVKSAGDAWKWAAETGNAVVIAHGEIMAGPIGAKLHEAGVPVALHDPAAKESVRVYLPPPDGPHAEAPSGIDYREGARFSEIQHGGEQKLALVGVPIAWVRKNIGEDAEWNRSAGVILPLSYRAKLEALTTPPATTPAERLGRMAGLKAAHSPGPSSFETPSGEGYRIDRLEQEPKMPTNTRIAQAMAARQQLLALLAENGVHLEPDSADFHQALMMLAKDDSSMLEEFQDSPFYADINEATEAFTKAVGHAQDYLSFLEIAAIHAAAGDAVVQDVVRTYFRAVESELQGGWIDEKVKADMARLGIASEDGDWFHPSVEPALQRYMAEVIRQASGGDGENPVLMHGGLPFEGDIFGGHPTQDLGAQRYAHLNGRWRRFVEKVGGSALGRSLGLSWMLQKSSKPGRFFRGTALPRVIAYMNDRAMNDVVRPARAAQAAFHADVTGTVQRLAMAGAPLPRRVARRIPGIIRSGAMRNIKSAAEFGTAMGGPQYAYLFPVVKEMVEQADIVGLDLAELGYLAKEQLRKVRGRYMLRDYIRAEEKTSRQRIDSGDFVGSLPGRDLRADDGRQDLAMAILHPEYLHAKGMMQEAQIRSLYEILQNLEAQTLALPMRLVDTLRADGTPLWDDHTRQYLEVGAYPVPPVGKEEVGGKMVFPRDPVTGHPIKPRQHMLWQFLNNMRQNMADEGQVPDLKNRRSVPYSERKAQMLEFWLGPDFEAQRRALIRDAAAARANEEHDLARAIRQQARDLKGRKPEPNGVITKQVGMEIETILRDYSESPVSTEGLFGADGAITQGVLAEHWFKRMNELTRWWRRAVTIQNPVHWTLARTSDVFTNYAITGLPISDFATSVIFGKGTYADTWRHMLWWQRWAEMGRPKGVDGVIPEELAKEGWTSEQWSAVQDMNSASEYLLGGTFVTAMIESQAIPDLIGGMLKPDEYTAKLRQDLAERQAMGGGGENSAMLADGIAEAGRKVAMGTAHQEKRIVEMFEKRDAQSKVDAIHGWVGQYQIWELSAKYAAALHLRRQNPAMTTRDAMVLGARGTADYPDTSPWLRRWSTNFNFARDKGWDAGEKAPGVKRAMAMATASPFFLYYSAMIPAKLYALVRNPLRVGVVLALEGSVRQAVTKLWGEDPEEEDAFLRSMSVSRDAPGTPLMTRNEGLAMLAGDGKTWLGGFTGTEEHAAGLAQLIVGTLLVSPHIFSAPHGTYGVTRSTSATELMPPVDVALEGLRAFRDMPQQSSHWTGKKVLEVLPGLTTTWAAAALATGLEILNPRRGEDKVDAAIRAATDFGKTFAPAFHPEAWIGSRKGQLSIEMGPLAGQSIRDYFANRAMTRPMPAEDRAKTLIFGSLWRSKQTMIRPVPGEKVELGRAILNQIAGGIGVEGKGAEERVYLGASRKVGDQFFKILGATYDEWRNYDFPHPSTLDRMLAPRLDVQGDLDQEALERGVYRLKEGKLGSTMGVMIAKQPASEQPALIRSAVAFLDGPAWDGGGRSHVLDAGRARKLDPPMFVSLYRAAVFDSAGHGMIEYLHDLMVKRGRVDQLADTHPMFLETRPPENPNHPVHKKWEAIRRIYAGSTEPLPQKGGQLPRAKTFGPLDPFGIEGGGREGAGQITGPGAKRVLAGEI
jgi:ParB-like chromosome segregation protein Spo0J